MPVKLSQKQIIIIGAGVALVIVVFVIFFLNIRPSKNNAATQAKLNVWGTEDVETFAPVASGYPYGQVTYTRINPAHYEAQLLSALAAGTGPDVLEIGNRELPKWKSVLASLPTSSAQQFGALQLGQIFPDVVAQDFTSNGQIYALPLSIDTLAMLYNKDLFNSAGIAIPPANWDDFDVDVARLRVINPQGQLTRYAAAIGGSQASIPNAPDILFLLMLQNGTRMTEDNLSSAKFASGEQGIAAFNFYLQFANAASPYYTWDDGTGNAFDSFVSGRTAIVFAYQADLAVLKAKAPFVNIGIASVPQAKGASVAVNYPKYSGFAAAKAGQAAAAWNFILYLTTTSASEKMYTSGTGHPPAQRAEIQASMNDPNLSVFATQALTARSWYEADDAKIDGILSAAIQNVLHGAEDAAKALHEAEAAVGQLMSGQQR